MMKKFIYISVSALLIFISIALVALYYTQDFKANYSFVKTIDYGSIKIDSYPQGYGGNDQTILRSAEANIGVAVLSNKGYFTQIYTVPKIVGCINLSPTIDPNSAVLRNNLFYIQLRDNGVTYSEGSQININVGEEKTYNLFAVYSPNIPTSQFSRDNIKAVSIYQIPQTNSNPIREDYPYDTSRTNYYQDCNSITKDLKPLEVIQIN